MPRGVYVHLEDGVREHFQCAPGPAGWRYVAELSVPDAPDGAAGTAGAIDLTVDSRWRQIRLVMRSGGWLARGGVAGHEVLWLRAREETGTETAEHAERAAGFVGRSPAFLVAVARMLELEPGTGSDVRLVRLAEPALAALTVRERWVLAETTVHQTDIEPLRVERYEVADLATGEGRTIHLAGDVVLAAPGIELDDLDNPPHFPWS
ncbi:MAG: hypothetical protein GEV03_05100 [Streptosporangiales bacterium]|nr:hypothetical protein [Streptosporangiales bacterium]